ncbi:MAG: helix-turn-helix domain-containing protein [Planctomycetaceae bacterium]|nr:helix-turn-helix domain-containing protein [Planctomycetaceae bacterium]
MGKIPNELRETIARNIRDCRMKKFPGRGGGKRCAEEFGVSPQQWSPWERGMRTPDELRLQQIADFFEVTVEYLRRDNTTKRVEGIADQPYMGFYSEAGHSEMSAPSLREPDAPPYGLPSLHGLPSLRREDNFGSLNNVAELSAISGRLLAMVCSTTKGMVEGRFDVGKTIIVLRRLGDVLEQKLREADSQVGNLPPPPSF